MTMHAWNGQIQLFSLRARIAFTDLRVQRPKIVKHTQTEQTKREQIEEARAPLPHVESMHTKKSEERQEDPCDGIIDATRDVLIVRGTIHRRDQEKIDKPANKEQPKGEEPDRSGDWSAVIETM